MLENARRHFAATPGNGPNAHRVEAVLAERFQRNDLDVRRPLRLAPAPAGHKRIVVPAADQDGNVELAQFISHGVPGVRANMLFFPKVASNRDQVDAMFNSKPEASLKGREQLGSSAPCGLDAKTEEWTIKMDVREVEDFHGFGL